MNSHIKNLFLLPMLLAIGNFAHAATINWTNTASGGWNTAANWSPNQVPGTNDTAIITNVGVTVSLNGTTTVGAIILGSNGAGTVTLSLAGQTLTLNGPLTVNPSGSFTVDSGALVGNTNAVLNGTIGWTAGLLEGILTLASGSTLNLTTANNHDLPNCTFTNNGTVAWASGTIRGGSTPGTVIYNYGLWDAQSDQQINAAYNGSMVFNNFGTFRKSGGASEFANDTIFLVVFNQLAGVLDVQNGTNGLQLAFQGGGNFTGGYITTNSQGLTVLSAGNYTINGTVTGTNTWEDTGNLVGNNVINGALTWVGGVTVSLWNNSTVTILSNSTVIVTGGLLNDMASCIVTNKGTVTWASGTIRGGQGTAIYNYGLWDAQSDQSFNDAYGGATVFNNYGTFRKSGGASEFASATIFQSVVFNQLAGVIDVQNGTNGLEVEFQDGGNFTGGYITTNSQGLTALSSGNFTVNGTVTGTNTWQNGGSLVGANVINGGLTWVGGYWNNAAFVTIATNSTVIVAGGGGNNDMASCIVTNNGTVVWASGTIRGGGTPGTVIYNYGLWDAQSGQTFNDAYTGNGTVFNNFGTLRKSAGGDITMAISAFNNAGTIDVQTNSVIFQTVATFSPGSVFNGAGSTILSAGTFNINGATINSTLQFNGGTIGGTNILSGTFIWNGGLFNSATLMITISGALNIVGAGNHDLPSCTLINNGTVTWANGTIRGGSSGTTIYNYGLWDAQGDQELNDAYSGVGVFFNNFGTFRKSAGTKPSSTTIQGGVAFVNDGTVDVQNGLMLFSGSFTNSASTLAVENGATIQIAQALVLPGGLVTGSGTVQAPSITSSAVVSPGATNAVLNLAGNYTQLLGGSMQFDIGGTSPGVNQSQVNVTGSASLSGLIGLRFSPGYVPAVNSSNLVLTAGSRSGQFAFQDHFYLLGHNERINQVYSPTNLVLTTIAAADPTNFSLSTAVQGQTFALAWPSEFGNYNLYTKTNLDDTTWTIIPGVTNLYIETPMTSPHKFFRLF
jgi:hypothetical protein